MPKDNLANGSGLPTFPSAEFCIIESRDAVKDFAKLQLAEITDHVVARQNRIFLLMEEVRRLRIQQRLKGGEVAAKEEMANEKYVSALPFLPPLEQKTLNQYYTFYAAFVATVILFGGVFAPILELKLGLGGTSYQEFVESVHLPRQLAQVDPIVASFCGGSVGVLSALLVVEVNNVKKQQRNRCHYCEGTGYLSCGACVGTGREEGTQCACCAGTGKVMCTGCFCTGKQLISVHDPRIDPFAA